MIYERLVPAKIEYEYINSQRMYLIEHKKNSKWNNEFKQFWDFDNANTCIDGHCCYCSYCNNLKSPYKCLYCDHVSTRRWNISTHIQRKHKGLDDPFKLGKEIVMTDALNPAQNTYDFSNSFSPQIDYSETLEVADRLSYIINLSKELRKLSMVELCGIINKIRNFPQFKRN